MAKKLRTKNRFELYEASVQSVDFDVYFTTRLFRKRTGREALSLREDFCGTFSLCCEWVKSKKERTAIGIDLSTETLNHGRTHHLAKLSAEQQKRVLLLEQNVISKTRPVDLICAQNFSFFTFKTRAELIAYFKKCLASLKGDGMLLLDMFGGTEAEDAISETRKITHPTIETFDYIWEMHDFNPIDRIANFSIHFRLKNRTFLRSAFQYHWRMWTIPEIRELLEIAGFGYTEVLWEEDDGSYLRTNKGENEPTWLAYIAAGKKKWKHA
jgi:hypothetical protein